MTIMVALVGGQVLPNFLPVRHYHPSDVLLVHTQTMSKQYETLSTTLQREVRVHDVKTDPYNILAIAEELENKLNKLMPNGAQPLVFNLTGGTKAMALAAYQVAQQRNAPIMYLESEGKQTRVFHYNWQHQQVQEAGSELLPELVTLKDILDLHLGEGNWQEHGSGRQEGSPFEDALANTLRKHGYEVMVGVKTTDGQTDIDVAVRSGNHYGIIEAKSGKGGNNLDGVKQLSTAARRLGSTYSQTFLAITIKQNKVHKDIIEALRIQVISLLDYDNETNMNTLPPEDEVTLLASVDKALKG